MALGGVFINHSDGNLKNDQVTLVEKVSGMLFDISKQPKFFTEGAGLTLKDKLQGNVIELNSLSDLATLGITAYSGDATKDLMYGIPYYHIKHYFDIQGGTARLFVMFADCSQNFDAIQQIQRAAHGIISQFGVWTDQSLWKMTDPKADSYSVSLVTALQSEADELSARYAPAVILLNANTAVIKGTDADTKQVVLSKIPNLLTMGAHSVTVLLGQGLDTDVSAMQLANENCTPVGNIGAALGCIADGSVGESIAWVKNRNVIGYFPDIEFGFGDVSLNANKKFVSTLAYTSVANAQLDDIDNKGYVFLQKYAGIESGVYFTNDYTCDGTSDFHNIINNRTINKVDRMVRQLLLPYTHAPLKVDSSTGYMSSADITIFQNLIGDALDVMKTNGEISGRTVSISSTQNILKTKQLLISCSVVPYGTADTIKVTTGLTVTTK